MEDNVVVVQSDDLDGFSYTAVFDGHAGFSSVKFLSGARIALNHGEDSQLWFGYISQDKPLGNEIHSLDRDWIAKSKPNWRD
ncbi:hypothetical protein Vadar_025962 [Vaccinium darrowii]|nr:hypothetical protein Vadar_025962 [Vaccinium darrowii]